MNPKKYDSDPCGELYIAQHAHTHPRTHAYLSVIHSHFLSPTHSHKPESGTLRKL